MRLLKQSTSYELMLFMADSSDHVSGKTGLTLTITASKAGAAFASITPTVTERGNGWYSLALTTAHTDTLGDFALHVTGTGADPADAVMQVRTRTTDDVLPTASYTTPPTAAANAAAVVSYDIGNGRTVGYFLQGGHNKIVSAADGLSYTVYGTDDTTELKAGVSTRLETTVGGLRSIDPA